MATDLNKPADVVLVVSGNEVIASVDGEAPIVLTDDAPEDLAPVAEVLADVSSDAVEIARIEADARVEIAELNAAVEIVKLEEENSSWQIPMQEMQTQLSQMAEQILEMEVQLLALTTPPPESVADLVPTVEVLEASEPEKVDQTPPEEPAKRKPRYHLL